MKANEKLNVILWGETIGALTWDYIRQVAVFQFSERYHQLGYSIQPTKPGKPVSAFFGEFGEKYHGLPSFIADSLPDSWGSTVFDKWAKENGIQPKDCNSILKLAHIGRRGIGALEYKPEASPADDEQTDLASLEKLACRIYQERSEAVIGEKDRNVFNALARLGSPPGGAHAKILIAVNDNDGTTVSGQTDPKEGYTQYILKFKENHEIPTSETEYAYYLMAKKAGISMMPSRLVEINGTKHFITQRFDRKNGEKLFTQTMAALIPKAVDYQNLFFLCNTLKLKQEEREELFRRMCFNVVAGNTDDHNKNFSFIMYRDGHWELAPAYDMTFTADIWENPSDATHSLGIYSKRSSFTCEDLVSFGNDFEINRPEEILHNVCSAVGYFKELACEIGIQEKWADRIADTLDEIFPDREMSAKRKKGYGVCR